MKEYSSAPTQTDHKGTWDKLRSTMQKIEGGVAVSPVIALAVFPPAALVLAPFAAGAILDLTLVEPGIDKVEGKVKQIHTDVFKTSSHKEKTIYYSEAA